MSLFHHTPVAVMKKLMILAASALTAFGTWAATLSIGNLSMSGNTLSIPVTVSGGGEVSLSFGAAEPKDGEPQATTLVETKTAADGETITFEQTVTLGKKVAYRLVVDGDEKSGTYEVQDPARYQWKAVADGRWSDATKWQFETAPTDGLDRLGYPSYGSYFVFKGCAGKFTVEIDGVYSGFAESRFGRDNEKMSLTLKGTVPGATLGLPKLDQQGTYKGNDLTLDGVSIPNIEKWVVRENCTLTVKNGGVLKTRWEFRVAKENAKLMVGPEGLVVSSNAEPYHRLGLAGNGSEIVIDDGTLVCGQNLAICNGEDGSATSPKGITFKGSHPQLQIRGYAKNYQNGGTSGPMLTFEIPEDGYERTPIVKAGTESDHGFIDKDSTAFNCDVSVVSTSPFLQRAEYKEQTLVDWTFNGGTYRLATENFNLTNDALQFGPADLSTKSFLTISAGEKPLVPGTVIVTFDPNGGELADTVRILETGVAYGSNKNLYPALERTNFVDLNKRFSIVEDGTALRLVIEDGNRWNNYWTKTVPNIYPGLPYTYVIDVLDSAGTSAKAPTFNIGHTGGDQPSQLSGGGWFGLDAVGRTVKYMDGRTDTRYTTLERAYVDFSRPEGDEGTCDITFRVALFAGKLPSETTIESVASGAFATCPLPVPTRTGFDFVGWTDDEGTVINEGSIVTAMGGQHHTLTARWARQPGVVIPVKVTFDPNGGQTTEKFRWVNTEEPYARTLNLYPSDARENFHNLSDALTLEDNVFTMDATSGQWVNMFTKNIPFVEIGAGYTYVLDILSIEEGSNLGWLSIGRTGGYWAGGQQIQLKGKDVQPANEAGVTFVPVVGADYEPGFTTFNYLGRDYFHPAADTKATFRVSLFAGASVDAENYTYVAPGQGMPLALPTATREGKIFDCWVDPNGKRVTDETIVDADGDFTLTAQWKNWTVTMANGDRPAAGKPLSLAVDFGEDAIAPERVSYKWFRADPSGVYELLTNTATNETYIPTEADYQHFLKGVCYLDGEPVLEKAIWFSKLPVVYVTTEDGEGILVKETYKSAALRIQGNAKFKEQYNGLTEIKGRGNSTWGMPKKPYKLKLDKKTDLFGFGKQKHWTLIANYIDESSLRNKFAYDISGAFGLTYMESEWVELVFNGRYDGMYVLCEHIRVDKGNRVDIYNWDDDPEALEGGEDLSKISPDRDITGGYLWELSNEYDELSQFKLDINGNGVEDDGEFPVMFNTPEFAYTNPRMMAWAKQYWQDVYASWTSLHNESASGVSWKDLCDIDSMIAYWLVNEIFGNDDAWYKSRYCSKDLGGKLTFGPVWDFDWGCGSTQVGMDNVTQWRLAQNNNSGWPASFYKQWLDDPWFCARAWEKYWEMRPAFAAMIKEGGTLDEAIAYLREAGAADTARWASDRQNSFGSKRRGFDTDAEKFKEWMTTRLAWLDEQFATPGGLYLNLSHGESAQKTENREEKLGLVVIGEPRSNGPLTIGVKVASSTTKVDVLVNGRYLTTEKVTKYGWNSGIVDEIVIPNEAWYDAGHQTVVQVIGISPDTGAVNYRNSLVIKPKVIRPFIISIR